MTWILVLGTMLAARALATIGARSAWSDRLSSASLALRPFVLAIVVVAGVLAVRPSRGQYDLRRFVEVDRVLRAFHDLHPRRMGDPQDIAMAIDGIGSTGNYLDSIACLHHSRDETAMKVLGGQPPERLTDERFLITSEPGTSVPGQWVRVGGLDGGLAVLEAATRDRKDGVRLYLRRDNPADGVVLEGFGAPEYFGRWTVATKARFRCTVPIELAGRVSGVRLALAMGFAPGGRAQRVGVSVNGGPVQGIVVEDAPQSVLLTFPAGKRADVLDLGFDIPGALSPRAAGVSADPRLLGLALTSVELVAAR